MWLNFGIPDYFSVRIPLRNNEQRIPFGGGEKMYSSIHHTFYCWKFSNKTCGELLPHVLLLKIFSNKTSGKNVTHMFKKKNSPHVLLLKFSAIKHVVKFWGPKSMKFGGGGGEPMNNPLILMLRSLLCWHLLACITSYLAVYFNLSPPPSLEFEPSGKAHRRRKFFWGMFLV